MTTTSTRKIVIAFSGDVILQQSFPSAENEDSPADIDIITLAAGANTITVPGGGSTVKGVTIIPPELNEFSITLKGVTGDTGIVISPVDPTSIGLDGVTSFVLTAEDEIVGVRLIWT